jgi:hypothetical protein
MPGDGLLQSVMRLESSPVLRLSMRFDANEYTGLLAWDPPPPLAAVESLLKANLGREIRVISDLDI